MRLTGFLIVAIAAPAAAQTADQGKAQNYDLTVTPAAEPTPALKYRLFPLVSERTPGDAAPVYLRLRYEFTPEWAVLEKLGLPVERGGRGPWLDMPIGELPLAEARTFVDSYAVRLRLLGYAAHRSECDWSYTLPEERSNVINVLLPDAQAMRTWARLLSLKARVEIAEGKHDEAIRTIATGLAFARHLAEGPFLINDLIGISVAMSMLDRIDELIASPGATNLYWALTALHRPFISMRDALEYEDRMGNWMVPELDQLGEPRSEAEWAGLLDRMLEHLASMARMMAPDGTGPLALMTGESLRATRPALLAAAKEATSDEDEPMGDDERIARYLATAYATLRDAAFAPTYLDYAQTGSLEPRRLDALNRAKEAGPALAVLAEIIPAIESAKTAEARLERRIAALRAVEAIRWHAAGYGGRLPASLDQVEVAPVPTDPFHGRPFGYRVEGRTAVLTSEGAADRPWPMSYRVTMRE